MLISQATEDSQDEELDQQQVPTGKLRKRTKDNSLNAKRKRYMEEYKNISPMRSHSVDRIVIEHPETANDIAGKHNLQYESRQKQIAEKAKR